MEDVLRFRDQHAALIHYGALKGFVLRAGRATAHWRAGWLPLMYLVSEIGVLCMPFPLWGLAKGSFRAFMLQWFL